MIIAELSLLLESSTSGSIALLWGGSCEKLSRGLVPRLSFFLDEAPSSAVSVYSGKGLWLKTGTRTFLEFEGIKS
jgi:hypothetical protein